MREQLEKLIEEHTRIASQYEAVGDASTAAEMRAVGNMLAAVLRDGKTHTLHPELTPENIDAHRQKMREIEEAEKGFAKEEGRVYDDWEDEIAYEEGATRTLVMLVRKPKDARPTPFLDGIMQAARYWRRKLPQ